MSDTIYRKDAINALEKLSACEDFGVEIGTDEETYIGKYEAITVISDLPSADRPQEWIPCSERLPNENGDYLVTLENGVVKILGYSTTQRTTYPKGFYHIKDGFSWRQMQNPVVAWMPLPKPWKGADDE